VCIFSHEKDGGKSAKTVKRLAPTQGLRTEFIVGEKKGVTRGEGRAEIRKNEGNKGPAAWKLIQQEGILRRGSMQKKKKNEQNLQPAKRGQKRGKRLLASGRGVSKKPRFLLKQRD